MKRMWLAAIIVLALVIIGIVVYLASPHADETDNAPAADTHAPAQPSGKPTSAPPAVTTCVGPMDPQVSKSSLVDKHKWAESLLLKKHLDAAVTQLRSIATLDPGYPAINFEIADALLKSKHASDAKDAIKLQLEISECLSALPPTDLQAYCDAQGDTIPPGGCAPALAKINQQAHYKAGLIDAELAHPADTHPAPPAKAATPVSPGPAAATVQPAEPVVVPKPLPPVKIQSIEATDHVGQQATVCGAVVSKHTAEYESNGKPTFSVNPRSSSPRTLPSRSSSGEMESAAVGEFPDTGNVCVTGKITLYRGNSGDHRSRRPELVSSRPAIADTLAMVITPRGRTPQRVSIPDVL